MPDGQSAIARSVEGAVATAAGATGAPARAPETAAHHDAETAETAETAAHHDDEERPARTLSGPVGAVVATAAFGVSVLALWQVFRPFPQGSQFYLMIFLAGVLPLVFLAYRSGVRLPARLFPRRYRPAGARVAGDAETRRADLPTPVD